jgi:hypothetical protein
MPVSRLVLAASATLAWLLVVGPLPAHAKEWTKITIATEGSFPPYMTIAPDGK